MPDLRRASSRPPRSAAARRRTSAGCRRDARSRRSTRAACPTGCGETPRRRAARPGSRPRIRATRCSALIDIANAKRSFGGKNDSTSMTPIRVIGGCCTRWISVAQVGALAGLPRRQQDRRQQDVLAALQRLGVDAGQRQQARHRRLHALAQQFGIVERRARERASAPTRACRRCCPACRCANSAASRSRLMRAPSSPHSASPFFHRSACSAAKSAVDFPARRASSSFTHGAKSSGRRSGNVSSRLVRSPLGSMTMTGTPSIAASSMTRDAQPGLAAARHADAQRVGDEILGVVEHQVVGGLLRAGVVVTAEIEHAEFFEVLRMAADSMGQTRF